MLSSGETIDATERRERGIVQPSAHAETHDSPTGYEDTQIRRQRKHREARRKKQSAANQHRSATELVDATTDQGRDQTRDQQAERQAGDDPAQRPIPDNAEPVL